MYCMYQAANIEVEAYRAPEGEYQLTQEEVLVPGCGKYSGMQSIYLFCWYMISVHVVIFIMLSHSEWSTIKYSNDGEKLKLEMDSDDEEIYFFDTQDCFPVLKTQPDEMAVCEIERRKKLPDPAEKEKGVSLWSLIKDNVGKDLTRVCLPVYFNEPISSLQKCFEDLEYSYLLDQAYYHGKEVQQTIILTGFLYFLPHKGVLNIIYDVILGKQSPKNIKRCCFRCFCILFFRWTTLQTIQPFIRGNL